MGRFIDIIGQKFGRLEVKSRAKNVDRHTLWDCECACGSIIKVRGDSLKSGHTKSCGCFNKDAHTLHGHNRIGLATRTYASWCAMRSRCYNTADYHYPNYGGRGIKVCVRWLESF
jgi:hypothetical protein